MPYSGNIHLSSRQFIVKLSQLTLEFHLTANLNNPAKA